MAAGKGESMEASYYAALQNLVGLKIIMASHAASLRGFIFGPAGESPGVLRWIAHIQCPWRMDSLQGSLHSTNPSTPPSPPAQSYSACVAQVTQQEYAEALAFLQWLGNVQTRIRDRRRCRRGWHRSYRRGISGRPSRCGRVRYAGRGNRSAIRGNVPHHPCRWAHRIYQPWAVGRRNRGGLRTPTADSRGPGPGWT